MTTLKIKDNVFTNNVRGDVGLSETHYKAAKEYLASVDPTNIYLLNQALVGISNQLQAKDKEANVKFHGICNNTDDHMLWLKHKTPAYYSINDVAIASRIRSKLMRIWLANELGISNLNCQVLNTCYPVEAATINAGIRKITARSNSLKLSIECKEFFDTIHAAGELWENSFRHELLDFLIKITADYMPSWLV